MRGSRKNDEHDHGLTAPLPIKNDSSLNKKTIVAGYKSAGFLAYLTYDVDGNAVTDIPFDTEAYDDGDNYNPSTGIYTVPYDGLYLIHARVLSSAYNAAHWVKVDGVYAATSSQYDLDYQYQSASTSIVLHLVAEQEVAVEVVGGTIDGTYPMGSTFGATLLYGD